MKNQIKITCRMPPQASDADFWHQTSVKIAKSLHADSANIEESIALKDLIVVRGYLCIAGTRWLVGKNSFSF